MPVDLAEARIIGRQELERTLAAPDEWACEWDYDELPDSWVLIVDRVEYYKVADRFAERTTMVAPITVSKADGSVTRQRPEGPVLASVRFPEDFDIELQQLPDEYMFRQYSRAQVSQWARRLRMFRFVRETPRESWFDEFAACFRISRADDVEARLRDVGIERRPMAVGRGTFAGEPPIVHYLEERLVNAEIREGILRVSISDSGGIDDAFTSTERLEKRMIEAGWEADRVETTALYDQRCAVTPRRYPELFVTPPYGPL